VPLRRYQINVSFSRPVIDIGQQQQQQQQRRRQQPVGKCRMTRSDVCVFYIVSVVSMGDKLTT